MGDVNNRSVPIRRLRRATISVIVELQDDWPESKATDFWMDWSHASAPPTEESRHASATRTVKVRVKPSRFEVLTLTGRIENIYMEGE